MRDIPQSSHMMLAELAMEGIDGAGALGVENFPVCSPRRLPALRLNSGWLDRPCRASLLAR